MWFLIGSILFSLFNAKKQLRTSVLHPASTTHRQLTDEQLVAAGIKPEQVRMSIGIENVEDLLADLDQALKQSN